MRFVTISQKQGCGMSCKKCDFDICDDCYGVLQNIKNTNANKRKGPPKKRRQR